MTARFRHDDAGTTVEQWRASSSWAVVPERDAAALLGEDCTRLVVVAAHPDDETLGTAGLLHLVSTTLPEVRVDVVVLTDGEGSHPASPTHPPRRLAERRRQESRRALEEVCPDAPLACWSMSDGEVGEHHREITHRLVRLLADGRRTVVLAPFRGDGHPDHEAAGRAAAAAALRCGARLLEYPVWWWHWGRPEEWRPDGWSRVLLPGASVAAKARALQHHRTQVAPLSDSPGDEQLLGADFLAHFERSETFLRGRPTDTALEDLHRREDEPWSVDTSWYERRKRAVLLAVLPEERLGDCLEVGCSTGHLTRALGERSTSLVAVDSAPTAVRRTRERTSDQARTSVTHLVVPEEWPVGEFDTVVLSEVGYFLSPLALDRLRDRLAACQPEGSVLVLCHWVQPIDGWPLDGPDVHEAFEHDRRWRTTHRYADPDAHVLVLRRQRDPSPAP